MAELRRRLPHAFFGELDSSRSPADVPGIFTVGTLVALVQVKLAPSGE